jgi:hypothetical protein
MDGETPQPGIADLPEEDVQLVRDLLAKFVSGEMNRFDVFEGEINDNQGNTVIGDGERMEQADMDQFPPGAPGLECEYCMYWFNENIIQEVPPLD